jgi:hypothetical protein
MRAIAIRVWVTISVVCWLALAGCYHSRVAPIRSLPADDGHSVTEHALVWGLYQARAEQPDCQGNGVAEVTATSNLGYSLISVVTLGFWMPSELEWKCAKDKLRVDTELQ